MKNLPLSLILLFCCGFLSGCQLVGDIFGAGVYTGVFLVIFIAVVIIFVLSRVFKRK